MITETKEYINIQTQEILDMEIVYKLKDNAMLKVKPELFIEWNFEKNDELGLDVYKITKAKASKVWWNGECGHEWESHVYSRVKRHGCPYCNNVKSSVEKSLASLNPQLASEWHPTKNGEKSPKDFNSYSNEKVWWLGKCGHEWDATISNRNMGNNCPYCTSQKILVGFNDMNTTNPELSSLLENSEDSFKYMQNSHTKVNWKCPECNQTIKNKAITDIKTNGLTCPSCSDGIRIPEKTVYSLLRQLKIDFDFQRSFSWYKNKLYDFYIPSSNLIIETHGEQHYKDSFQSVGGRTLEEEQENDELKEKAAKENGIENYIIIDCRYSEIEWIKNSVLNSKLSVMFDLNDIDWISIEKDTTTSLLRKACELWEERDDSLTANHIAINLKLSKQTIIKYLKRGTKIGLCSYCPKEEKIKQEKRVGIKIARISQEGNILEIYSSINQAHRELGIPYKKVQSMSSSMEEFKGIVLKYI